MPSVSPRRSVSDTPATAVSAWRVPRTGYSRVRSVATSMRCRSVLMPAPPPTRPAAPSRPPGCRARSVSGGISVRQRLDDVRAARRERAPAGHARRVRRRTRDLPQPVALGALAPAGSPPAGRPCTDARARRTPPPVGPSSTTWPAYITSTRWATRATTPRSWVTHTTAIDICSRSSADEGDDLLLDRHVEGGRRLVGDQHLGPQRQRHGDDDALAHAAGELVGIGPRRPCRAAGCRRRRAPRSCGRAPRAATFRGRAAPRRSARRRASAG